MSAPANSAFRPSSKEFRGMNVALAVSLVIHAGLVLALFIARNLTPERPKPMVITLGGTTGPRTTGISNIGGQTVEEVTPPPKRLEPVKPPPPKQDTAPVATRTPPPSKMVTETPKPEAITTRPPVTGRQIQQGPASADTNAQGQGQGLTQGGGGGGAELTDLKDFPAWYIEQMKTLVDQAWTPLKRQSARGTNIIRFTVQRNGTITDIVTAQTSGISMLDRASTNAVAATRLPPLPGEYKGQTLRVQITFPYTGE